MKKEEITALVRQELEGADFDNWHGITKENIDEHLIEPVLEDYEERLENNGTRKYSTVLHEDSAGRDGLHSKR